MVETLPQHHFDVAFRLQISSTARIRLIKAISACAAAHRRASWLEVPAMSTGDMSTAKDVSVELERLRAENARLTAEVSELRARLNCSQPPPTESVCQSSGRARSPSSDGPVFANELFVMIGGYLEPGTRSLLNLARASRALYELLLPRLYERFSLVTILSKWYEVPGCRIRSPGSLHPNSQLPLGAERIKALDSTTPIYNFNIARS